MEWVEGIPNRPTEVTPLTRLYCLLLDIRLAGSGRRSDKPLEQSSILWVSTPVREVSAIPSRGGARGCLEARPLSLWDNG